MKSQGHPVWNPAANVTCVCGNAFTTGSTLPDIRVEICAKCHPFFTGTQKLVDTQGQVEKFTQRQSTHQVKKVERQAIVERRSLKTEVQKDKPTLKDLLMQARRSKAAS